jgi:hypothetical protein
MVSVRLGVFVGDLGSWLGTATGAGDAVRVAAAAAVEDVDALAGADALPTPILACADINSDAEIRNAMSKMARCIYTPGHAEEGL